MLLATISRNRRLSHNARDTYMISKSFSAYPPPLKTIYVRMKSIEWITFID